jgi:hypothetical protein
MQVAGRWKSAEMPAHYAKAELAERGAIARFKDGSDNQNFPKVLEVYTPRVGLLQFPLLLRGV